MFKYKFLIPRFLVLILISFAYNQGDADASQKLIYKSISSAQIRIPVIHDEIDPIIAPPVKTPLPEPTKPVIIPKEPSINILQLNLSIIPAKNRGILYDTSRPIDFSNPVRIINSLRGGYNSIFVQNDQYYNISIGTIPTSGNSLKPPTKNPIDLKNIKFLKGAILQSSESPLNLQLGNITIKETHSVGMNSYGRLRYTIADKNFRINGFLIPKGFIIVARRKPGLYRKGYPNIQDFEDFRVYNPSNSALVKIFNYQNLKSSGCLSNKCFDMNKFATPRNTWQFGAKIFSNFSTRDLFGNISPWKANKLWISLQSNLEAQTILRINSRFEGWAKRVLKELNEDEFNYINHINNFEMKNIKNYNQKITLIKGYFGFANISYPNKTAKELHENVFKNLWDLAVAKTNKWQNNDPGKNTQLDLEIIKKRKIFIDSLKKYETYIKRNKIIDSK